MHRFVGKNVASRRERKERYILQSLYMGKNVIDRHEKVPKISVHRKFRTLIYAY